MAEARRVLVFDAADERSEKRFQMCRTAILIAGDRKGTRDRETIRKEARLLDALDSISEVDTRATARPSCPACGAQLNAVAAVDGTGDGEPPRRFVGGRIELSAEDHALLTKYLDTAPWLPASARAARDVQDFVDTPEKIEG
jgi:hypothetical protein